MAGERLAPGRRRPHGLALAALLLILMLVMADSAAARPVPFQRGVTITDFGRGAYPADRTERLIRSLKKRHVDSVTLFVIWLQDGRTSVKIGADNYSTVSTFNLTNAIRVARRHRMRVVLRPYVDRRDGIWRGYIEPADRAKWWSGYRKFILRYADLARKTRVSGFVVGTEMASMSGDAVQWRSLVKAVRKRFRGFITYQANHGGEERSITWWDAVDAISVSGYYPLGRSEDYSVADLVEAWKSPYALLQGLSTKYKRPLMFGEIGYRSITGSAMFPWDLAPGTYDPADQARAYEAALKVWFNAPFLRGFYWWYVSPWPRSNLSGRDHEPVGPALRTLGRYYKSRRRARPLGATPKPKDTARAGVHGPAPILTTAR